MVADVLLQDLGVHPVWHATRLLTGVIWGHVCGLGVLAVVRALGQPSQFVYGKRQ